MCARVLFPGKGGTPIGRRRNSESDKCLTSSNARLVTNASFTNHRKTHTDIENRVSMLKQSDEIVTEAVSAAHSGLLRECAKVSGLLFRVASVCNAESSIDDCCIVR